MRRLLTSIASFDSWHRRAVGAILAAGAVLLLATALRTPQVRGAWGEQSLRRIVEISGLKARCDFDDQQTYTAADGSRFRPDMRVNRPDSRVVFVDAKAPLAAILDAYKTARIRHTVWSHANAHR